MHPQFAAPQSYLRFQQATHRFPGMELPDPGAGLLLCDHNQDLPESQPSERSLQMLWNEQQLGPDLRTTDGRVLEVLHPGTWNVAAGPDFSGARLRLGGIEIAGAVEVHRHAGDWYAHGHDRDLVYGGVVLHVVWSAAGRVDAVPGLPVLCLQARTGGIARGGGGYGTAVALVPDAEPGYPYARCVMPGACAARFAAMERDQVREFLEAAGLARFREKAEKLFCEGVRDGFEQALYAAILEAFGYRMNREPMRRLAAALPLAELRRLPEPLDRAAAVWGGAGLLPDPCLQPLPAGRRELVRSLWDRWWTAGRPPAAGGWSRCMQRPANRPERRLQAALNWLESCAWRPQSWLERVVAGSPRELLRALTLAWQQGVKTAAPAPILHAAAPLGGSRIRDLLANVALPFLYAHAVHQGKEERARLAEDAFRQLPRLQSNRHVEEMAHRLLVPASRLREVAPRAVMQQGLLKIRSDFCRGAGGICAGCPVAAELPGN